MSKQRAALELALDALDCIYSPLHVREINKVGAAMAAIREALAEPEQKLNSALEALQNEMRETISKLDPNEMVWIHQPPGMPPILCKEPVVGAVPVYALSPTLKITEPKPNARKPLTEPELHTIEPTWPNEWNYDDVLAFARAIERAHGIGND